MKQVLAQYFLKRFALANQKDINRFSVETQLAGLRPGAGNYIERAIILSQNSVIEVAGLSQRNVIPAGSATSLVPNLKQVEEDYIQNVLNETGGIIPRQLGSWAYLE